MKKQLNIPPSLAALFIAVMINSTYGQGNLIIQHSGANDPTSEGFVLSPFGNPQVGPVTNAMNAWSVTVSQSDGASYVQALTPQEYAEIGGADWTLSLTLQVVSARLNGGVSADVFIGSELFWLEFATNSSGHPIVQSESPGHPIYTLSSAGSSYNNYQLVYDAGTDTAVLWVDGVEAITDITGLSESPSGGASVGWGASTQAGSQANWSLVSLEIVPEPSAMSLLFLGGGFLIYVRIRNKKHQASAKPD